MLYKNLSGYIESPSHSIVIIIYEYLCLPVYHFLKGRSKATSINIQFAIFNLHSISLLFNIRHTDRSRWGRASNSAGQNDNGEDIRDHVDKLRGYHLRQIRLEGFAEPEKHSGTGSAERGPFAEDHGCQADKAPAGTNAFDKVVRVLQRQVRTGHPGQGTAEDTSRVAHLSHADAQRISRLGMLTHRAQTQAEYGFEDNKMGGYYDSSSQKDQRRNLVEELFKKRNFMGNKTFK